MNRERAKQLLPIIQAFADGKEIEVYYCAEKGWRNIDENDYACLWIDAYDYRIKPEPREWMVSPDGTLHLPKDDCHKQGCFKVREVIE